MARGNAHSEQNVDPILRSFLMARFTYSAHSPWRTTLPKRNNRVPPNSQYYFFSLGWGGGGLRAVPAVGMKRVTGTKKRDSAGNTAKQARAVSQERHVLLTLLFPTEYWLTVVPGCVRSSRRRKEPPPSLLHMTAPRWQAWHTQQCTVYIRPNLKKNVHD